MNSEYPPMQNNFNGINPIPPAQTLDGINQRMAISENNFEKLSRQQVDLAQSITRTEEKILNKIENVLKTIEKNNDNVSIKRETDGENLGILLSGKASQIEIDELEKELEKKGEAISTLKDIVSSHVTIIRIIIFVTGSLASVVIYAFASSVLKII